MLEPPLHALPEQDRCEITTPVPLACNTFPAVEAPIMDCPKAVVVFTDEKVAFVLSVLEQNQNVSVKFAPPGPP